MSDAGKRLNGKVAIVTGGGSGFGAAICERFGIEGCHLLIGDINEEGAHATAKRFEGDAIVQKMDVTKAADWNSALEAAEKKWGKVDIIVNNAGWSYKNRPTKEVDESDFDRVFEINVKSIFLSVQAAIPYLQKARGGSIINISSVGSIAPRPGLVWYNSSKAAVTNATKGLASEYGKEDIRVNAICPLLSGTGLFEAFVGVPHTPENVSKFVSNVPLGRLTDPMDVANAALYLASDEARFVTGLSMVIDGGKSIS